MRFTITFILAVVLATTASAQNRYSNHEQIVSSYHRLCDNSSEYWYIGDTKENIMKWCRKAAHYMRQTGELESVSGRKYRLKKYAPKKKPSSRKVNRNSRKTRKTNLRSPKAVGDIWHRRIMRVIARKKIGSTGYTCAPQFKRRLGMSALKVYNAVKKPKAMYTCLHLRDFDGGSLTVSGFWFSCVKPSAKTMSALLKSLRKTCLKNAKTDCRCTLVDVNGKNALPRYIVKKYLMK